MKAKNIIISIITLVSITGISCKKILTQPLEGQYSSADFFTNDANANLAVNAAYTSTTFTDASSNAIWVLGDVASDDAIKGGNPGDQSDFRAD